MRDWINIHCKFCNKLIEDYSFFPPDCDCKEYKKAKDDWLMEIHNSEDYEPPLTAEEYDEKYPEIFNDFRIIKDKDGEHKIRLEARKFSDGEGLTVSIPFDIEDNEDESVGLCWDFSDRDAKALHEMLTEYLKGKK